MDKLIKKENKELKKKLGVTLKLIFTYIRDTLDECIDCGQNSNRVQVTSTG